MAIISRIPRRGQPGMGAKLASALAAAGGGYLKGREQRQEYELKKGAADTKAEIAQLKAQQFLDRLQFDQDKLDRTLEQGQAKIEDQQKRTEIQQQLAEVRGLLATITEKKTDAAIDAVTRRLEELERHNRATEATGDKNADTGRIRATTPTPGSDDPKTASERSVADLIAAFDPAKPPEQSTLASFVTGQLKDAVSTRGKDDVTKWTQAAVSVLPKNAQSDPFVQEAVVRYVQTYPDFFFDGTPPEEKGMWEKIKSPFQKKEQPKDRFTEMLNALSDSTVTAPR